jgi:predicted nucleic acid-binding protein
VGKKSQQTHQVKIVVDTNIIFSTLLNSNGALGDLIFNSEGIFEFYSCDYMRFEIDKHWAKLRKISKLSEAQLKQSYFNVISRIQFVNEELIPAKIWSKAEQIAVNIDIDDTDFIALTLYLKGALLTGDKVLYKGLKDKKNKHVFNALELLKLRSEKE